VLIFGCAALAAIAGDINGGVVASANDDVALADFLIAVSVHGVTAAHRIQRPPLWHLLCHNHSRLLCKSAMQKS
jgi:hypothetical protein